MCVCACVRVLVCMSACYLYVFMLLVSFLCRNNFVVLTTPGTGFPFKDLLNWQSIGASLVFSLILMSNYS